MRAIVEAVYFMELILFQNSFNIEIRERYVRHKKNILRPRHEF